MATPRRVAVRRCAVASLIVVGVVCVASATFAAPPTTPARSTRTTRVRVAPRQVWTPTGIVLHSGETVRIDAAGRMRFGAPPIDALTPDGIPRGPKCAAAKARQGTHESGWPAPTLNCWSLIGRIGSAPAFEIGDSHTTHVITGGELFVGLNDDYLTDNAGVWLVTVRTSPVSAPAPALPSHSGSGGSSRGPILAAALVVAFVALVVLILWRRRARSRGADAVVPSAASPALGAIAPPPGAAGHADGELSVGNIFEVAVGTGSMRVGYSHFPEGTVVRWRVAQDATVMTGEFTTDGRGDAQRAATIALSSALDPHADAAEVTFTWNVGGVAFNYAVHPKLDT